MTLHHAGGKRQITFECGASRIREIPAAYLPTRMLTLERGESVNVTFNVVGLPSENGRPIWPHLKGERQSVLAPP